MQNTKYVDSKKTHTHTHTHLNHKKKNSGNVTTQEKILEKKTSKTGKKDATKHHNEKRTKDKKRPQIKKPQEDQRKKQQNSHPPKPQNKNAAKDPKIKRPLSKYPAAPPKKTIWRYASRSKENNQHKSVSYRPSCSL